MKKIILFFVLMFVIVSGCDNAEEQEKVENEEVKEDVIEETVEKEDETEKEPSEFRIIIDKDKTVSEEELTINKGDIVVFVNENRINHNILIYPKGEENLKDADSSGNFLPGETFRYDFNEKGTFIFRDRYSSEVRGTIIVE